jgi:hypothetical protein
MEPSAAIDLPTWDKMQRVVRQAAVVENLMVVLVVLVLEKPTCVVCKIETAAREA